MHPTQQLTLQNSTSSPWISSNALCVGLSQFRQSSLFLCLVLLLGRCSLNVFEVGSFINGRENCRELNMQKQSNIVSFVEATELLLCLIRVS